MISAATRDEHHNRAGAHEWPALPIAMHLFDVESSPEQGIGQLGQAAKAQLAAHGHDLVGGGEDVVALEADPAITYVDQIEPGLHRPVLRVEPLAGGLTVPVLPGACARVAAFKG